MARPSGITALPPKAKEWLDAALLEGNFQGYEAVAAALKERGYNISKSGVHRYGQKLERRLQTIRASTEAAKLIMSSSDDDADALGGSVLSLVQSELFDALLNLREAEESGDAAERIELLGKAAKSISELSRASINTKKWQVEMKAKAQSVADKAAKLMTKGGLSADTVETIKREILGIPS